MHRSFPLAALALSLAGCTHLGTNITGDFSCGTPKAGCESLSEVDAKAIFELIKAESSGPVELRQRTNLAAAVAARTGERTLKVVLPAHVDGSGALHEQAVVWTVVEAARWAGTLRRPDLPEPRGTMRALSQALKDQARRAADAARKVSAEANLQPLTSGTRVSGGAGTPAVLADPFNPSSPLALPSPGGEVQADATVSSPVPSAAEGSDMFPTPHVRAPRPFMENQRVWPSAAAIKAAKALGQKPDAAPKMEPK